MKGPHVYLGKIYKSIPAVHSNSSSRFEGYDISLPLKDYNSVLLSRVFKPLD